MRRQCQRHTLIRIRSEQDRNRALQGGFADFTRATQVVEARYASGLGDYGAMLDARASEISAHDRSIRTRPAAPALSLG